MNSGFFLFIWLVFWWVFYLMLFSELCPCFTFKMLKTIVAFWG